MKHVLIPIAIAVAMFSAQAQDSAASAPATGTVATDQLPAGANPFTGKPLSAETLVRRLELSKLQSSLYEEQLRQMSLQEEAKTLPTRKQAEAAIASTALAREKVNQLNLEKDAQAAKAVPAPRPDAQLRGTAKPKPVKAAEEQKEVKVQAPAPRPAVNVLSVLSTGGKRSAMLEVGNDVVSVEDGQSTPFGVVHITDQGVRLDDRSISVNDSTIGRVRRGELDMPQTTTRNGNVVMGVRPDAAAPQSSPAVTQLPPLVLPPSVRAPAATPGQAVTLPPQSSGNPVMSTANR